MHSKVDVINLALANLANLNFIQDVSEDSPEAVQAAARWDTAFDSCLAEHPWSFAAREGSLAEMAGDGGGGGRGFQYLYPEDCLRLVRIFPADRPEARTSFAIGRDGLNRHRVVKTPCPPPAAALYVTRDVPVPELPADFVAALSWRLASELALVRADPNLAEAAFRAYRLNLERARLGDAEATGPRPAAASRWEAVRHV